LEKPALQFDLPGELGPFPNEFDGNNSSIFVIVAFDDGSERPATQLSDLLILISDVIVGDERKEIGVVDHKRLRQRVSLADIEDLPEIADFDSLAVSQQFGIQRKRSEWIEWSTRKCRVLWT
jgi:hypothetical protein